MMTEELMNMVRGAATSAKVTCVYHRLLGRGWLREAVGGTDEEVQQNGLRAGATIIEVFVRAAVLEYLIKEGALNDRVWPVYQDLFNQATEMLGREAKERSDAQTSLRVGPPAEPNRRQRRRVARVGR